MQGRNKEVKITCEKAVGLVGSNKAKKTVQVL
jgi:hypothetical protein